MTNYQLAEFKLWLTADQSRKQNLPNWEQELRQLENSQYYYGYPFPEYVEKIICRPRLNPEAELTNPYQQILHQWASRWHDRIEYDPDYQPLLNNPITDQERSQWTKIFRDQAERERERERERTN